MREILSGSKLNEDKLVELLSENEQVVFKTDEVGGIQYSTRDVLNAIVEMQRKTYSRAMGRLSERSKRYSGNTN